MSKRNGKDSIRYSQEESDRTLKKLETELKEEYKQKRGRNMNRQGQKANTKEKVKETTYTVETINKEFLDYLMELQLSIKSDFAETSVDSKVANNDQHYAIITSKSNGKERKLYIYNIVSEGRKGKIFTTILVVNAHTGAILFSKITSQGIRKCDKWIRDILVKNIMSLKPKASVENHKPVLLVVEK